MMKYANNILKTNLYFNFILHYVFNLFKYYLIFIKKIEFIFKILWDISTEYRTIYKKYFQSSKT